MLKGSLLKWSEALDPVGPSIHFHVAHIESFLREGSVLRSHRMNSEHQLSSSSLPPQEK